MSQKQSVSIVIQICSNCKQHNWCTRHNQQTYLLIAKQIQTLLLQHDSTFNITIVPVGGTKMGSFQIYCNDCLIFSKLKLGYFPLTQAVTSRIFSFIDDYKQGNDIQKYHVNNGSSPIKSRPQNNTFTKFNSPQKKNNSALDQMRKTGKIQNKQTKNSQKVSTHKKQQTKKQQPKKQQPKKQQIKKALQTPKKTIGKKQQTKKEEQPKLIVQPVPLEKKQEKKSQKKQNEHKDIIIAQTLIKKQQKIVQNHVQKNEVKQKQKQTQKIQQNKQTLNVNEDNNKQKEQQQSKKEQIKQPQKQLKVNEQKTHHHQAEVKKQQKLNQKSKQQEIKVAEQTKLKQQSIKKIQIQPQEQKKQQKSQVKDNANLQQEKYQQEQFNEEDKKQSQVAVQNHQKHKIQQKKVQPQVHVEKQKQKPKKPVKEQVILKQSGQPQGSVVKYQQFQSQVDKVFKKFDRDTTGMIEKNEFKQLSEWLLNELDMDINDETKKYFNQYFVQIADSNKDGKISFEEFKKICWECLGDDELGDGQNN